MLCVLERPEGPKVVLVKSLDSGRWILPKGWPMAGRSLAEAAAQEAWEEAGARGRVLPQEVARFTMVKRRFGGLEVPAEVVLFRMEETVLAEDYPEAGKRIRRVFSVREAIARIEIKEMAKALEEQFSLAP